MYCSKCGNQFEGRFCTKCGAPAGLPVNQNVNPAVNNFSNRPVNMGAYPGGMPVQNTVRQQNYVPTPENKKKKGKKSRAKVVIAVLLAVVLVLCTAVGSVACVVLNKPTVKFGRALEKTLTNAKSFAFEVEEDSDTVVSGSVKFGSDLTKCSAYIEDWDGNIPFVLNDGKLVVWDDFEIDVAECYDWALENGDDYLEKFKDTCMLDEADDAFELAEDMGYNVESLLKLAVSIVNEKGVNEDTVETIYDTILTNAEDITDIDILPFKYFLNNLDIDYEKLPDYKELKNILTKYLIKLDRNAISVGDSHKKDGIKIYELDIDYYELAKQSWEFFSTDKSCEDLFEMFKDIVEKESDYDEFEKGLEEGLDYIDDHQDEIDFNVEFGIKNGYLCYLAAEIDDNEISLTISEIGEDFDFEDVFDDCSKNVYEILDIDEIEDNLKDELDYYSDYNDYDDDYYDDDYYDDDYYDDDYYDDDYYDDDYYDYY